MFAFPPMDAAAVVCPRLSPSYLPVAALAPRISYFRESVSTVDHTGKLQQLSKYRLHVLPFRLSHKEYVFD